MKNNIRFALVACILMAGQTAFSQADKPMKLNFQNLDWSPDGKSLLLSAIHVKADWSDYDGRKWEILLLDLETGKVRKLANAAVFGCFSPDGKKIAYGKLTGDNWDIEALDLASGQATKVTALPGNEGAPSWSPDGSQIVYHAGEKNNHELFIVESAGGGTPRQLTNFAPQSAYNPIWSPGNDSIVFYLEKGDQRDQVWLTDSKGSFFKNLTADTLHNIYPAWAPGGDIIFSMKRSVRLIGSDGTRRQTLDGISSFYARFSRDGKQLAWIEGGDVPTVFVKNYPNGEPGAVFSKKEFEAWRSTQYYCAPCGCKHDGLLFDAPGKCPACQMKLLPAGTVNTTWINTSPHGDRLAFATADEYNRSIIFTSKPDGTGRAKLTDGNSPQFSPDGQWVLYEGDSIGWISLDGKTRFNLSTKIGGKNLQTPAWSPDGKSVLLSEGEFPDVNLLLVSLETFESKALTQGANPKYAAAFSPDGKKIAFTQMSRNKDERGIWLLDPATGQRLRLTEQGEYLNWAPDGKSLVFHKPDGELFAIYSVGADGKNLRKLSSGEFDDELPRWSADGSKIYFQSKRTSAGNWELYEMQPDGSGQKRLFEQN